MSFIKNPLKETKNEITRNNFYKNWKFTAEPEGLAWSMSNIQKKTLWEKIWNINVLWKQSILTENITSW